MNNADRTLLPEEGLIVAGFSGGADSTALAYWLLQEVGPKRLLLAHVNHGLRGEESDRDEAHARQMAQQWGVPLRVHRADVAGLARREGAGLEECGRRVRYAFFDSLLNGREGCVCTAHTADDNVETLLLHLARGAALSGLCGIPKKRGRVVRPLLGVTRREVEAYCLAHRLPYVTDSTNASFDYARNRVRAQVVPVLTEINPQLLSACGRAMAQLTLDREYLEQEAERLLLSVKRPYGLDCRGLLSAHESLRGRALYRYLTEAGCRDLEEKHIALCEGLLSGDGALSLPGGVKAQSGMGLFFAQETEAIEGFALPVGLGENLLPGGKRLVLAKKTGGNGPFRGKIQNLLFKNGLDYATIYPKDQNAPPLIARTRRPGDRFSPLGRGLSKPLGQALREAGVPPWARDRAVLLERAGRLVYCEGLGPAEGFGPGAGDVLSVEVSEGRK